MTAAAMTPTAVVTGMADRPSFTPQRCARCDVLIYESIDEAVAADSYWRERFRVNNITGRPSKRNAGDPMGARLIPHVNGAVGDLCAACARETAGHKGLVTGRQIAFYEKYFGGPFPAQEMSRKGGLVDKQEYDMRQKMDDQELVAAHRRYVMENLTLKELAEISPMSADPLRKHFIRLNLPTRTRGSNAWAADDLARVCAVHGLQPDEVPGPTDSEEQEVGPEAEPPAAVAVSEPPPTVGAPTVHASTPDAGLLSNRSKKPRPTAVAPAQATAVAVNGNGGGQASDLHAQLGVIQELLSLAEAKQVTLRGKISVELHAEVAF